jgi:hypothetical protein
LAKPVFDHLPGRKQMVTSHEYLRTAVILLLTVTDISNDIIVYHHRVQSTMS